MQNRIICTLVLMLAVCAVFTEIADAQRIYVENATLKVNGNPIFINGANTPWDNWNDFGGSYDHNWWNTEFGRIKNAGGNATRIWITCSGEVGINIDSSGYISGATQAHWDNLADLFQLAQANQIYILATLISFDHTKNTYTTYQRWRNMYSSTSNVNSFVTNYVVPFVNRFKNNPYLFAIEPCNEIEWVNQDSTNAQLPWSTLQYFCARVVAAVHENSDILATIGVSMKWQTDVYSGSEGNQFSDAMLRAQYNDSDVYLDVYSPHFYDWVTDWFGNPCNSTNVSAYGLTDKPVIIGELPANGVGGISINNCYINGYANGLQGLMPWTSNGVDSNGSLDSGLGNALTNFKNSHPGLVYPSSGSTPVPSVPPAGTPGDVNGDGSTDIVDALLVAQYYVNLNPSPFHIDAADTNCDGNIDIVDALLIAQFYVGLIAAFC
ncbi:MAG: dockerin type I repeat-containing protein [Spirochaetales bacterium]|nr:dockerin type I repeat-containing protein [Spirochaetales bacterium]